MTGNSDSMGGSDPAVGERHPPLTTNLWYLFVNCFLILGCYIFLWIVILDCYYIYLWIIILEILLYLFVNCDMYLFSVDCDCDISVYCLLRIIIGWVLLHFLVNCDFGLLYLFVNCDMYLFSVDCDCDIYLFIVCCELLLVEYFQCEAGIRLWENDIRLPLLNLWFQICLLLIANCEMLIRYFQWETDTQWETGIQLWEKDTQCFT